MPVLGEYDALVRNECCLICNGTDNRIIAGTLAEIREYPVMLGHESAGFIIERGSKVRNFEDRRFSYSFHRAEKRQVRQWLGRFL